MTPEQAIETLRAYHRNPAVCIFGGDPDSCVVCEAVRVLASALGESSEMTSETEYEYDPTLMLCYSCNQEEAAWWISHDGKRRLRVVKDRQ